MALNAHREKIVAEVDKKVKAILDCGGDEEALLIGLFPQMPDIKSVMDGASAKEMDMYCYAYEGFFMYMKLLEQIAQGIANGDIQVPE